jgi:hypothetical protein
MAEVALEPAETPDQDPVRFRPDYRVRAAYFAGFGLHMRHHSISDV